MIVIYILYGSECRREIAEFLRAIRMHFSSQKTNFPFFVWVINFLTFCDFYTHKSLFSRLHKNFCCLRLPSQSERKFCNDRVINLCFNESVGSFTASIPLIIVSKYSQSPHWKSFQLTLEDKNSHKMNFLLIPSSDSSLFLSHQWFNTSDKCKVRWVH